MGFTPSLFRKRVTESSSSLVHVASGAVIFTLLLLRRVAFLRRTATCRPLFKPRVANLQDNRAVFQIFIAPLRFSFDSPSCLPISVAVLSKAQVARLPACGLAGLRACGSEFRQGYRCLSVGNIVCCPAEVSATG